MVKNDVMSPQPGGNLVALLHPHSCHPTHEGIEAARAQIPETAVHGYRLDAFNAVLVPLYGLGIFFQVARIKKRLDFDAGVDFTAYWCHSFHLPIIAQQ